MSDTSNLRDTITPKSDQLNADDLIGTTKVITVTAVKRGSAEQPISINFEGDNGKPYLPCKSMRRVLIFAWGDDGREWIGRSLELYCDPEVKFGGVKVGGIRISKMSHIAAKVDLSLTVTRAKRQPYTVFPLEVSAPPPYPADRFEAAKGAIAEAIKGGKTHDQIIAQCEKTGVLSEDQKKFIQSIKIDDEQY